VFPAGEVAHRPGAGGSYADSDWRPTVGRLALGTGAQVVPASIAGRNSKTFYTAGRLHAALRTALLPRELLQQRGRCISVRLGSAIAARDLPADANRATREIRHGVDALRHETAHIPPAPTPKSAVEVEIANLPPGSCLVESGAFQVFLAGAGQIPAALGEIGRLRELTYRAIGEGTGRHIDIDRFDGHYQHLFCWDSARRRLVGAYRIGRTDRILAAYGVAGLYTRTLFRFDERFLSRVAPALELGRSFVRAEYQKHYNALLLLWKGIGRFVARHPEYRVLFGPVSISARYSDASHQLLIAFLRQNHLASEVAALVDAINPQAAIPAPAPASPSSIEETNRMIARAEADGKGVPILLRHYLKLNARLIGFNVDRDFGEALDALMMVDLTTVDRSILNRYLGSQEATRFLAYHRRGHAAA
jgi:putative hemolysin